MKKLIVWLTIFSFFSSGLPAGKASAQPPAKIENKKIFLAVLELDNKGGLTDQECSLLTDTVRQEFFSTGRYRVVDRKNMDRILKEQGFQLSDCTSEECAVKVGQLLGVEKMAIGSVGKLGQIYIINLQLLNVESGEIESIASDRCPCEVEKLLDPIKKLAQKISGAATSATGTPATGGLKITSEPGGASVFINGRELGRSPLDFSELMEGNYLVKLVLEGYETYEEKVYVSAGKTAGKKISLKRIIAPGALSISANVPDAQVYLNGRNLGKMPLPPYSTAPGKYKVKVTKQGYADLEKAIVINEKETYNFQATLEKSDQKAKPWYKKAWVWLLVAGVVGGAGAAVGVLAAGGDGQGNGDTGDIRIGL